MPRLQLLHLIYRSYIAAQSFIPCFRLSAVPTVTMIFPATDRLNGNGRDTSLPCNRPTGHGNGRWKRSCIRTAEARNNFSTYYFPVRQIPSLPASAHNKATAEKRSITFNILYWIQLIKTQEIFLSTLTGQNSSRGVQRIGVRVSPRMRKLEFIPSQIPKILVKFTNQRISPWGQLQCTVQGGDFQNMITVTTYA